jgi:[protein-PII] uridylyltransferase
LVLVETTDRLGLLYDLLQALADSGLNVSQARIHTEGGIARDTIHVTDGFGRKLLDGRRLELLRVQLESAILEAD